MPQRLDRYHFYEREFEDYESLRDWFEWEIPDQFNVTGATVERQAAQNPDREAIITLDSEDGEKRYTYRELDETVTDLATVLADSGVERGDRVAINAPQSAETIISHLAVWKLGAVSVPLSVRFGPDSLAYRIGDCDVTAAVVGEEQISEFTAAVTSEAVSSVETLLTIGRVPSEFDAAETTDFWSAVGPVTGDTETVPTGPDDDAMILYTSGTTGDPKGVRHAHRFLLGHLPTAVTGFFNISILEQERLYTPVEWAWVGPIWAFVLPAFFYGKTAIADPARFDPERTLELVDRYDVTRMLGPATVWRRLGEVDDPERFDTTSVETIMSAGESMGAEELSWVKSAFSGAAVHEGYGQTEAMNLVMDCSALFEKHPAKMGKATPGTQVRIVDPETGAATVSTGEVGEIAVKYDGGHPLCFKEYWNKPGKTENKVKDGWLLTEDLGFIDEDGYFEFVSRKDEVIICSGYRVSPEEVQEALLSHEAVANVGVIGVPDESRGEVPKAFVVLEDGFEPSKELTAELQSMVKDELAAYEYPREIEYRSDLPTTGSGKVARSELE
jgi:acetyl-CoA synthetase